MYSPANADNKMDRKQVLYFKTIRLLLSDHLTIHSSRFGLHPFSPLCYIQRFILSISFSKKLKLLFSFFSKSEAKVELKTCVVFDL